MSVRVIAEIGSVHDGSLGNALALIRVAADCGAHAVKFQLHIAQAESLPDAPTPPHFKEESRDEYFLRTAFTEPGWRKLRESARAAGVSFIVSPFSIEALEVLEAIDVDGYKIASGEVTNLPLIEEIARTRRPVLLSTGMSNWNEIDVAVGCFDEGSDLTILQCTSKYPCPPEQTGLNVLGELRRRYRRPVGLSDHTLGLAAALGAVALGGCVIEKHLTFSRHMYGSDAPFATEPSEFSLLMREINLLDNILAHPINKDAIEVHAEMRAVFQKSIVAARDLSKGTVLSYEDLSFKKPGTGSSPQSYRSFLGRATKRPLSSGEQILETDLA